MRIPALVCAVMSAVFVVSAEQAPQQPVFRAGVELVTIDVVATTGDGSPIHNLKAADFELYEDGVRQEIRTFEFINFSSPPPLPELPPGIASNAAEPGGIFTVVIDEIGIQVDDVQAVRRAAQRFFDETLQPNDHVAVVRSGVNSGFFLTNDRALAVDAIAQSTGRRERTLGISEPGATDTGHGRERPLGRDLREWRERPQQFPRALRRHRTPASHSGTAQGDSLVQPWRRLAAELSPNRFELPRRGP